MEIAAKIRTQLALSGLLRVVSILKGNFGDVTTIEEMKPLNDFVDYKIDALTREAKFDDLVQLMPCLEELQVAALELEDQLDLYEYEQIEKGVKSSSSEPIPEEKVLPTHLRNGLNKLMKIVERVEDKKGTAQPVELEKEHPFVTSEDGTTQPQAYTGTPLNTTFIPSQGFLSVMSLEIVECQEKAVEIMRDHKKNLENLTFGWTDAAYNIDTCEMVLERLEPDRNLESLSIICYSSAKFPNWMVKENCLPCLQTLKLRSCRNLKMVPFLSPHLQKLLVENCHELMQLPPLPSLKWLKVENCHKLMQLPPLPSLRTLEVENCHGLMPLPPLFSLEWLKLENCHELMQLPHHRRGLELLKVEKYHELMENRLKGLEVEDFLEVEDDFLDLEDSILEVENDFQDLEVLFLDVEDFHEPMQLPPNDTLLKLRLIRCPKLHALTNLSPTVTHLTIEDCPKLTSLGNLHRCTFIRALSILNCPMLRREEASLMDGVTETDTANRLPHVKLIETDDLLLVLELVQQQAFSSITYLTLTDCAAAALPNLEMLSSLKHLSIEQCPDVEYLPNLPNSLEALSIGGCPKLKEKYEEGGPLHNTISHIPVIKQLN